MHSTPRTRCGPRRAGRNITAWLIGAFVCLAAPAGAAPPAGTPVDNSAEATAVHPSGGSFSTFSDTVRALVQPVETLRLERSQSVTIAPGTAASLAHRLVNTGNVATSVRFDVANLAGDGFDAGLLTLTLDGNRDGLESSGEITIGPGDTLQVAAGEALDLLLNVSVPAGLTPPGPALVRLTATGLTQGALAMNTDTVYVAAAPPATDVTLFAEKTASRRYAEPGDVLEYSVRIANRSDSALTTLAVTDDLPPGFAYVAGTAFAGGGRIADPAGGAGPHLVFDAGPLDPQAVAEVRYRVRIGSGAPRGDALNTAWGAGGGATSNRASARVTVLGGVFAEEGSILGAVYADADGDGRRGAGDHGLAGVRLYLDDGTFALTDRDGQYSFYGLAPRTHALKLDTSTLPAGAQPLATDHRQGDMPSLRFVDLQRGEMARADFAVQPDTTQPPAAKPRDPRMIAGRGAELTRAVRSELPRETTPVTGTDLRARPAAGWYGTEGAGSNSAPPELAPKEIQGIGAAVRDSAASPALDTAPPRPVDVMDLTDPAPGFVGLAPRDTVLAGQIRLTVKGRAGFGFVLMRNGEIVPESRVGRAATRNDLGIELREYIGVALAPGENRIELAQQDPEGRPFGHAEVTIVAPGPLARLEFDAPPTLEQAAAVAVRVRALDRHGLPVPDLTRVTLTASAGEWLAADLDPQTPGVQVAVRGGAARLPFTPPAEPGRVTLEASAGPVRTASVISFVSAFRPFLAVGTFEGVVSLDHLSRGFSTAERRRSSFEAPMEAFRSERRDGRASAAARGALFMKGRIRDDIHVTLGYDSDRPDGLARSRDIQPDAYYPVYGDASLRGFEARTTGALYARVDHGGASTLYGDFVTRTGGGPRALAGYRRSLTGVQQHFENAHLRVEAFSSRERSRRSVEELRGLGVSGPYTLSGAPLIENSEQVEIVVRDRDQPGIVLSVTPRSRFTDYQLEPLTGRLTFKSPVPGFDADLNPVSIRVAYAREDGGDAFWVSGGEARVHVTDALEVGGTYVDDHDPAAVSELRGAFLGAKLGPFTRVEGEYASTRALGGTFGGGSRFELHHEAPNLTGELIGAITDSTFDNPYSGFASGRREALGRMRWRLGSGARLTADARYSAAAGGGRLGGLLLGFDQAVTPSLRAEIGTRFAAGAGAGGSDTLGLVALRMKLTGQPRRFPAMSAYTEYEQDMMSAGRRLVALGGEYRFDRIGRLYARQEWSASFGGAYTLNDTQRRLASVIGVDSDVARDAHVFGELRAEDALLEREAEVAVGLRHLWRAADGVRVSTTFERVAPLSSGTGRPSMAVTGAIESTDDADVKSSARLEMRRASDSRSVLGTLAVAARLDEDWTALARNMVHFADESGAHRTSRDWLQFGVAFRQPNATAWDLLGRYELRLDGTSSPLEGRGRRTANVLSLHAGGPIEPAAHGAFAWAGKVVSERENGLTVRSTAQWLHGRWTWDFDRDWDAGVSGSVLFVNDFADRQDGLGLEVGRMLGGGVWLSAGWNRFGYEDPDLPTEDYLRAGFYLRLRAKFDESLFGRVGTGR